MPTAIRRSVIAWVLAALLLGFDLGAPPARQISNRALLATIELYQRTLSPLLAARGVSCRFQPTCSRYAVAALRRYGALGGSSRAVWRLVRCAPWTPAGTIDPV